MLPKDGRMHFSNLKQFALSPAHYAMSCDDGRDDKKSFKIGRAIHAMILEGREPVVFSGRRAGNDFESFAEKNSWICKKEDILNKTEADVVFGSYRSFLKNEFAVDLLKSCPKREVEVQWDREGLPCAGRIDAYGEGTLIELKSAASAYPRKFLYEAARLSYHAQTPWYDVALGTKETVQTNWRDQYIFAVGSEEPYPCIVYKIDNLRIDQGNFLAHSWIDKYKECEKSGMWLSSEIKQPVIWDGEIITEVKDEED